MEVKIENVNVVHNNTHDYLLSWLHSYFNWKLGWDESEQAMILICGCKNFYMAYFRLCTWHL